MEYNRQQSSTPSVKISNADLRALENGAAYINDHFNCDISVDQLSHITCMGRTKLKLAFKEVYGVFYHGIYSAETVKPCGNLVVINRFYD